MDIEIKTEPLDYCENDHIQVAQQFVIKRAALQQDDIYIKSEFDQNSINGLTEQSNINDIDGINVLGEERDIITVNAADLKSDDERILLQKIMLRKQSNIIGASKYSPTIENYQDNDNNSFGDNRKIKSKCPACNLILYRLKDLRDHVALNICGVNSMKKRCTLCPMVFLGDDELLAHLRIHAQNRYFCRGYCGKYFKNLEKCQAHEFKIHGIGSIRCNICNVKFKLEEEFRHHNNKEHNNARIFACSICRDWFMNELGLMSHWQVATACGKIMHDIALLYEDKEMEDANANKQSHIKENENQPSIVTFKKMKSQNSLESTFNKINVFENEQLSNGVSIKEEPMDLEETEAINGTNNNDNDGMPSLSHLIPEVNIKTESDIYDDTTLLVNPSMESPVEIKTEPIFDLDEYEQLMNSEDLEDESAVIQNSAQIAGNSGFGNILQIMPEAAQNTPINVTPNFTLQTINKKKGFRPIAPKPTLKNGLRIVPLKDLKQQQLPPSPAKSTAAAAITVPITISPPAFNKQQTHLKKSPVVQMPSSFCQLKPGMSLLKSKMEKVNANTTTKSVTTLASKPFSLINIPIECLRLRNIKKEIPDDAANRVKTQAESNETNEKLNNKLNAIMNKNSNKTTISLKNITISPVVTKPAPPTAIDIKKTNFDITSQLIQRGFKIVNMPPNSKVVKMKKIETSPISSSSGVSSNSPPVSPQSPIDANKEKQPFYIKLPMKQIKSSMLTITPVKVISTSNPTPTTHEQLKTVIANPINVNTNLYDDELSALPVKPITDIRKFTLSKHNIHYLETLPKQKEIIDKIRNQVMEVESICDSSSLVEINNPVKLTIENLNQVLGKLPAINTTHNITTTTTTTTEPYLLSPKIEIKEEQEEFIAETQEQSADAVSDTSSSSPQQLNNKSGDVNMEITNDNVLSPFYVPMSTATDVNVLDARRKYPNFRFPYICMVCKRQYEQKYALRGHLQNVHKFLPAQFTDMKVEIQPHHVVLGPGPPRLKINSSEFINVKIQQNSDQVEEQITEEITQTQIDQIVKPLKQQQNKKALLNIEKKKPPEKILPILQKPEAAEETPVLMPIIKEDPKKYGYSRSKAICQGKFKCEKCGRVCSSKMMLSDHQKAKCSRIPQYGCKECGKKFFSASTLNCHLTIHTGELPHKCDYCDKRFRTRGQRTVHHRTHTGERPFVCQVCSQGFTHRETLISHLARHIGMKRYKCYGCHKQFSCISGLKTHRDTRPDTCGKVKLNSRAVGPRVRVINGNVLFEPQPEVNPYLRTSDPQEVLIEIQNQQQQTTTVTTAQNPL